MAKEKCKHLIITEHSWETLAKTHWVAPEPSVKFYIVNKGLMGKKKSWNSSSDYKFWLLSITFYNDLVPSTIFNFDPPNVTWTRDVEA